MAEKIKENQFDKVGVNPFNAPVPGESLTTPTDMPKAWEQPPRYTDVDDSMESIVMPRISKSIESEPVEENSGEKYKSLWKRTSEKPELVPVSEVIKRVLKN